jgi:endonuclease YncB( thermonuclease family)
MWHLSLLALLVFAFPAHSQTDNDTIRSSAKPRFQVVDGDTVKFGPQLVRLFGIDAPEKGQTCDDGQWQPGPLAKKAYRVVRQFECDVPQFRGLNEWAQ